MRSEQNQTVQDTMQYSKNLDYSETMLSGTMTPDIDIRKLNMGTTLSLYDSNKPLYTVLEPVKASATQGIFATQYTY
jgi:hypothetical protein